MNLYPQSLQDLYYKGVLNFVKCFSASNEMIIWFFFLQFIYMMDYIDRFSYVEPALPLWDEAYLIIMDNFLDVFLDSVYQYFIENFSSMFMSKIGL